MGKLHRRFDRELTLYVRQLAWLNASPKPDPRSRRGRVDSPAPTLSRAAQLKRRGLTVRLPHNPAPHLFEQLLEIGLTQAAGMGCGPISWGEINEWQRATRVRLPPWVARLLRRLSVEYVAEGRRAEAEHCPPPWRTPPTPEELAADERQLRAILG